VWTRSVLYLPSKDKRSGTLMVYDRTNAHNPMDLPRFERYRRASPDEQGAIQDMPALKQWVIHSPVEPMLASDGISWSTPDEQQVEVATLLPQTQRRLVYDEKKLWPTRVPEAERKWQVRIVPNVDQQWDTFLNVVQAFDAPASLSNSLLVSDNKNAEGVLVRRGGHDDMVLMFNAMPGPALPDARKGAGSVFDPMASATLNGVRSRSSGYSVRWT
jgi:hypothetical protein